MAKRTGKVRATGAVLAMAIVWVIAGHGVSASPRRLPVAAGPVPVATGEVSPLAMLGRIEPGRWELRVRDSAGAPAQMLCLPHGSRLIQLRHAGLACDSTVIDDRPSDVTVQYTCRGRGYGRTHVHRESGRLVQVETQGIAEGFPFDMSIEARRIGDCAG